MKFFKSSHQVDFTRIIVNTKLSSVFNYCLKKYSSDQSSRKYYYYRRTIGDPSYTHWRPIGDLSKTNMPDRRPRHASLETDMPHQRLTCLRSLIGISAHLNIIFIFLYTFCLFIHIGII